MCSLTDLRLFSLLWGETFLWPKCHVNQRLLQPSSLPLKGPSALASPWTGALEIACGAEAEAGGAAERSQAPLASLAGTGGPAALAVGLGAWLLDQPCTSRGTCIAPGLLAGATRNTKSGSGVGRRADPRRFEENYLGPVTWYFWRKSCSSEESSPQIFSHFN